MAAFSKILVPVDFSPCSDAALDLALAVATRWGAEVEVLHVWTPGERDPRSIFAETAEGLAFERRLSAAEGQAARVTGRLEFGAEPVDIILDILQREGFDLVVLGEDRGPRRELAASVAQTAPCRVVRLRSEDEP